MLNHSAEFRDSTTILQTLPGKLDIKRGDPFDIKFTRLGFENAC